MQILTRYICDLTLNSKLNYKIPCLDAFKKVSITYVRWVIRPYFDIRKEYLFRFNHEEIKHFAEIWSLQGKQSHLKTSKIPSKISGFECNFFFALSLSKNYSASVVKKTRWARRGGSMEMEVFGRGSLFPTNSERE